MQVSIIIPVFNEAPLIRPFLSNLRERTCGAEIIVVDGASTDRTDQLAQGFCEQIIRSGERSRVEPLRQALLRRLIADPGYETRTICAE